MERTELSEESQVSAKPDFQVTFTQGQPESTSRIAALLFCPANLPLTRIHRIHHPPRSKGYLKSFSSIESLSETSICHLVHLIPIQSKRLPENEVFEESRVSAKRTEISEESRVFAKLSQTNLNSAQRLQSAGNLEIRQDKSTR